MRDVPGVTRDRLYGQVAFERWQATVVDTGGFDPSSVEPLIEGVRRQVLTALDEADLVLFVVDARAGVTALDSEIAGVLRRSGRTVVVVANKIDTGGMDSALADLYRLGFGEPVPVSAEHGRGVAEMLEIVRDRAPREPGVTTPHDTVHLAVIGRPNVGKSSLVNAMVGAERVLVHAEPGTTRDAVDTAFEYAGRPYVLVDTAGIRRKGKVTEALEKLSVVMALRSLERCQVALLVIDVSEGLTAQDAHIAGYAHEAGRAVVLVVNKWDLVPARMVRRAEIVEQLRERLPFLDYAHGLLHRGHARRGHRRSVHRDRPGRRGGAASRVGQRADHRAAAGDRAAADLGAGRAADAAVRVPGQRGTADLRAAGELARSGPLLLRAVPDRGRCGSPSASRARRSDSPCGGRPVAARTAAEGPTLISSSHGVARRVWSWPGGRPAPRRRCAGAARQPAASHLLLGRGRRHGRARARGPSRDAVPSPPPLAGAPSASPAPAAPPAGRPPVPPTRAERADGHRGQPADAGRQPGACECPCRTGRRATCPPAACRPAGS